MNANPEQIASALLAEHDSLAALLHLLKEEQRLILQRRTDALFSILGMIEEQLLRVRHCQTQRREVMEEPLAATPPLPKFCKGGLSAVIRRLPDPIREQALPIAQRVDTMVELVHEFAWQNHILLSRSAHFLEEVLAPWLDKEKEQVAVYGEDGILRRNHKRSNLLQTVA